MNTRTPSPNISTDDQKANANEDSDITLKKQKELLSSNIVETGDTPKAPPETPTPTPSPVVNVVDYITKGSVVKLFEPLKTKDSFWSVTTSNVVTYYQLDGDVVAKKKKWNISVTPVNTGSRTLVIDGGIVFGRNGGHIWWISPDFTPEGNLTFQDEGPNSYKLAGVGSDERLCIVTYQIDGKPYIGIGYGNGKFAEMALNTVSPYNPIWKVTRSANLNLPIRWGYSCYVDKKKLVYYSHYYQLGLNAMDLKTLKGVNPASAATNGDFVSKTFPTETTFVGTSQGNHAYALFGDRDGNIYDGPGYYTFAHDHVNQIIWASNQSQIRLFSRDCLTTLATCPPEKSNVTFSLPAGGNVGPLSSLSNGSMIGQIRSSGAIFLMKMVDPKDFSKGITATHLDDAGGDPYMYTDFTGSTLYAPDTNYTINIEESGSFRPNVPVASVSLSWKTRDGASGTAWSGMKLEVRCYQDGGVKPSFEAIASPAPSGQETPVAIDSCKNKLFNRVDVGISSVDGDKAINNVSEVSINFTQ